MCFDTAPSRETRRARLDSFSSNATPRDVRDRLEVARVAHFATHAFANTDDKMPPASTAMVRNPLIGCGLALSGANSPGGTLDGETIAGLRLNGLDLTVLSACNTGVGRTIAGEGVYALRRAFHAAGCRTVVASLWAVDDLSTAALMTQFYHHLWVDEMPPEDALWRAQLDLYQAPGNIAQWPKAGAAIHCLSGSRQSERSPRHPPSCGRACLENGPDSKSR